MSTQLTDEGLTLPHATGFGVFQNQPQLIIIMKDKLTSFSQQLRKNMTKEEKHLWYDFLKQLPVTVNRQKVIGDYIADFYIDSSRLIIELDGSQHYTEKGEEKDKTRDLYFKRIGIKVLRYTNRQIHENFKGVCADIMSYIDQKQQI